MFAWIWLFNVMRVGCLFQFTSMNICTVHIWLMVLNGRTYACLHSCMSFAIHRERERERVILSGPKFLGVCVLLTMWVCYWLGRGVIGPVYGLSCPVWLYCIGACLPLSDPLSNPDPLSSFTTICISIDPVCWWYPSISQLWGLTLSDSHCYAFRKHRTVTWIWD